MQDENDMPNTQTIQSLLTALQKQFPTPFTLVINSTGNGNLALHLPDNRYVNHLFDDIGSLLAPTAVTH